MDETQNIIIMQALPEHLEAVFSLKEACCRDLKEHSIDQWDSFYPNKDTFLSDIDSKSLYIAMPAATGQIIGCIVFNVYQDPEYGDIRWQYCKGKIGVIHRLMVHPEHQGQGIAGLLIRYAEELARNGMYEIIRLDAFVENPRAIYVYKKLGYQPAGIATFRKGKFLCLEKSLKMHLKNNGEACHEKY